MRDKARSTRAKLAAISRERRYDAIVHDISAPPRQTLADAAGGRAPLADHRPPEVPHARR